MFEEDRKRVSPGDTRGQDFLLPQTFVVLFFTFERGKHGSDVDRFYDSYMFFFGGSLAFVTDRNLPPYSINTVV